MTTEIMTTAAEVIEQQYSDDVCVVDSGSNASDPVMIFGRKGWTSTPFQNAGFTYESLARWLHSEGGCPSRIAEIYRDGSAKVYLVEFADEADEDEGIREGDPVSVDHDEDLDAPESDEDATDDE